MSQKVLKICTMAFCSNCGTELTEGAKYCPKCGQYVNNHMEETSILEENNPIQEEEGISTVTKICMGALCLIAFAFLFLWALASDSDDGGGLYTYISIASIIGILAIAIAIYMRLISESAAIKTTVGIVAYFAFMASIVPTASEELRNQRKAKNKQAIEQKQESPAEKQAREEKEKQERKQDKINDIKRRAERESRILAQSVRYTESWPKHCQNSYISAFGTPSTDEDFEMYKIFEEEFRRNYFATLDAQQKMN